MLIRTLYFEQASITAAVVCSLIVFGFLKGNNRGRHAMYVGQHLRDKIAPEAFKKLVLIAVIAAGAELLRHGFFS